MGTTQLIYFGLLHAFIIISFLCALALLLRRKEGERSRIVLAVTWIIVDVMYLFRLKQMYTGVFLYDYILPIEPLIGGLTTIILLTLYPAEVIRPGWLRPRNLLLMFSPLLILESIVVAMKLGGITFRHYTSLHELLANSSEPEVWLRFIIIAVIYCYSFCLYLIPRKNRYGNVDKGWIHFYCLAVQGISVFYACNMLFGMYPSGNYHLFYNLMFLTYFTYQELNLRLFISPSRTGPVADISVVEEKISAPAGLVTSSDIPWQQLEAYMQKEQPWLNPDLTLPLLATAIFTNRTTLSNLIHTHGYDTFYDYIGHYRVNAFCHLVRQNKITTIQEAFFEVGFRSRTTAIAQFRKRMGVLPGDYIKSQALFIHKQA